MPSAQDHVKMVVDDTFKPAMRQRGFKVRGPRGWVRREEDGWLLVSLFAQRYNTAASARWELCVERWPTAVWELEGGEAGKAPLPLTQGGLQATPKMVLSDDDRPVEDLNYLSLDDGQTAGDARACGLEALARVEACIDYLEALTPSSAANIFNDQTVLCWAASVGEWSEELRARLDAYTASFQRHPVPMRMRAGQSLRDWRRQAGLAQAPLPEFSHVRMYRARPGGSPRAHFERHVERHGSWPHPIVLLDGSERPATADDFPDEMQIERWRQERLATTSKPTIYNPPPWLPWTDWLDQD